MATERIGQDGFLQYEPRYGILICRHCQNAIQKSAVNSHLLRHKIYRKERQRLLASVIGLKLLESNAVPLPSQGSPPIDALPVIEGFRCRAEACSHLTASAKRMQKHWAEAHSNAEQVYDLDQMARPAKLQNFFRGTKLRYFEILSQSTGVRPVAVSTGDKSDEPSVRHCAERGESDSSKTLPAIRKRLEELPSRMAEVFGKPANAQDVLAVLASIGCLQQCCEESFRSDEAAATIKAAASFMTEVPDGFHKMVARKDAAALVVSAHWAEMLVKRAERCGAWYLSSTAECVMRQVAKLPSESDGSLARTLIEGLSLPSERTPPVAWARGAASSFTRQDVAH